MTKYLLALGSAGMCFCVVLLGFWRIRTLDYSEGPLELSIKVDALVSAWAAQNIPMRQRAAVLVISDADDSDVLAVAEEPWWLDRLSVWLRRGYGPRPRAVNVDSKFVKAYSGDANTIAWTHEGRTTASQRQMVREIMRAIVKAHDAGAEIDVVTQGASVESVLIALKNLEGQARGGAQVGVNKLVSVGASQAALRGFERPANLFEWATLWRDRSRNTTIQFFGAGQNATTYQAEELYPSWTGSAIDAAAAAKELAAPGLIMERTLSRRAQAVQARAALIAKSRDEFPKANSPLLAPSGVPVQDSLSMIKAGQPSLPQASAPAASQARSDSACNTFSYECDAVCPGKCTERSEGAALCICPANPKECRQEFSTQAECAYACTGRCVPNALGRLKCECPADPTACSQTNLSQDDCGYSCPGSCAPNASGIDFECRCGG
jgi:hypothetical protein